MVQKKRQEKQVRNKNNLGRSDHGDGVQISSGKGTEEAGNRRCSSPLPDKFTVICSCVSGGLGNIGRL